MVGAAALALALQAAPAMDAPASIPMPANRLDCESTTPGPPVSYSFVFPFRRDAQGNWPKVRWIMTQRDGRSWIDEGPVLNIEGTAWPDFAADIVLERTGSPIHFRSDPAHPGRIMFNTLEITDHVGVIEEAGTCRIVPDLQENQGRAQ